MARSEYIYIVFGPEAVKDELPRAAFTVKKEMVRYLRRQIDKHALQAYRMRDGEQSCSLDRRPPCAEIPMKELLGE